MHHTYKLIIRVKGFCS